MNILKGADFLFLRHVIKNAPEILLRNLDKFRGWIESSVRESVPVWKRKFALALPLTEDIPEFFVSDSPYFLARAHSLIISGPSATIPIKLLPF